MKKFLISFMMFFGMLSSSFSNDEIHTDPLQSSNFNWVRIESFKDALIYVDSSQFSIKENNRIYVIKVIWLNDNVVIPFNDIPTVIRASIHVVSVDCKDKLVTYHRGDFFAPLYKYIGSDQTKVMRHVSEENNLESRHVGFACTFNPKKSI